MDSNYIQDIRSKIGTSMLLIPSVAAVIINEKNEILLQEKYFEKWSLPAGMIEPNESPSEAIYREVLEETGLSIKPIKILGVFGGKDFNYTYPNNDTVGYTIILMLCEVIQKSKNSLDNETKSLKYFNELIMPDLALPYPKEVLFNKKEKPFIS